MRHLLLVVAFVVCLPLNSQAIAAPNIVFFLVDDLGWADLGCYGSTYHKTPHIDALAKSGMKFTDAYAACPVCSPTRASIMTGKYPARIGITDWIPGDHPHNRSLLGPEDLHQLPTEEVTIAEVLRDAGYQTYYTGKWHLGERKGYEPTDQGFDTNVPATAVGDWRKDATVTDRLTNRAVEWIDHRDKSRPFFLYFSYHRVHTPILGHPDYLADYKATKPEGDRPEPIAEHDGNTRPRQDNAAYAADLQGVDTSVGRILTAIEDAGLTDDTIVIFFSDNGGLSTLRNMGPACNLPLRAGKGWLYEGGIRVPQIIRVPGVTQPGSESDTPVTSTDFYPTLLDLADIPQRPSQHPDGVSLQPLLEGNGALSRTTLFWHYPHYHGSMWRPGAALRHGEWKLIEFYDPPAVELYNLSRDLGELHDLSGTQRDKTSELVAELHDWQAAVGAKMPTQNEN